MHSPTLQTLSQRLLSREAGCSTEHLSGIASVSETRMKVFG
jgi:hypothetical protein